MSIYYIVSLRIVYYRYAIRPEVSENLGVFGGGILAEVDKRGFLCYNRNKFHCVKDAGSCFRLGVLGFALTSVLFVLLTVNW